MYFESVKWKIDESIINSLTVFRAFPLKNFISDSAEKNKTKCHALGMYTIFMNTIFK